MRKQPIHDEIEILQTQESYAESLVNFIQDGRIDVDLQEGYLKKSLVNALEHLTDIFDRAIRNRNEQLSVDHDPRHERYPYEH